MEFSRRDAVMLAAAAALATAARAEDKPLVLVAGASGGTGKLVCALLRKQGYAVRGLSRDPDRAKAAGAPGVAWIKGDVRTAASLTPALADVAVVISCVGAREKEGANRPEAVDYEGVRNLVSAAKAADVRQFLLESSCNVTIKDHPFNAGFNNLLLWKLKAEDVLRASGLAHTIVRPPQLLDGPGGRKGIRFQQGDLGGPGQIDRADVAAVLVAAVLDKAAFNKTFEIFGDASRPVDAWRSEFAALKAGCYDRVSCKL